MPCGDPALKRYKIECVDGAQRRYKFPAGKFALSQQVWLPASVAIQGAASPNVAGAPRDAGRRCGVR